MWTMFRDRVGWEGKGKGAPPHHQAYELGKWSSYTVPLPPTKFQVGQVHPGDGVIWVTGERIGSRGLEDVWLTTYLSRMKITLCNGISTLVRGLSRSSRDLLSFLWVSRQTCRRAFTGHWISQHLEFGLPDISCEKQISVLINYPVSAT